MASSSITNITNSASLLPQSRRGGGRRRRPNNSKHPLLFLNNPTKPSSILINGSSPFNNKTHFFPYLQLQLQLQLRNLSVIPSSVPPKSPAVSVNAHSEFDFEDEIHRLEELREALSESKILQDKIRVLDCNPRVSSFFFDRKSAAAAAVANLELGVKEVFLLKCMVAVGQEHVLCFDDEAQLENGSDGRSPIKAALSVLAGMIEKFEDGGIENGALKRESLRSESLRGLLRTLEEIEDFYDCIGGIIGYQIVVLQMLFSSLGSHKVGHYYTKTDMKTFPAEYHVPSGVDLLEDTEYASQAALWGLEALPELGEIYPMGGSGDRLGLTDPDTGECLPAALLPYCGRSLLEGLIRDLQAREFLYYKTFGRQCITPVAIMTSPAKKNHERIIALCENKRWFGRGKDSFLLFEQPQVPVVAAEDGQWLVHGPLSPVLKPGGHGVIWKLASNKGVFDWFYAHGRKGATLRQVSNVVAATDVTLLALAGTGFHHKKKFGFASCSRTFGATEGINVLVEQKQVDGYWSYGVTCIEYTDFYKLDINDSVATSGEAQFPANTNILYVDLATVERVVLNNASACLPGLVLNLKKPIQFQDHHGVMHSFRGGRLECTMQNLADHCANIFLSKHSSQVEESLDTFILYNERKRVTSSAKRKRAIHDKSLHQTPDGSLLDILRNVYDILSPCGINLPKVESNEQYMHSGPPFFVLLHPALGPLWEVTRQKFNGGSISKGSELQVEVAEFFWKDVTLDGSLRISAENIMGSTFSGYTDNSLLQYGHRCGRCRMENVNIFNKGIDWNFEHNTYWKNDIRRSEGLEVRLHGNGEFEARDVVLEGSHVFEVPNGCKLQITGGKEGISTKLTPIPEEMMETGTWFWKYNLNGSHFDLEMVEL